jgi:DNA-binding transcriptional LysR family regulator
LVLTSHHLHLLKDYFPRIIGLRGGRVFFDIASGELSPRLLSSLYGSDVGPSRSPPSMQRLPADPEKTLRVGVSSAGCESLAAPVLAELRRAHPDLGLSVRSECDEVLVDELQTGAIDVAFVLHAKAAEDTALIPVCRERVVLVCLEASSAPLSAHDLPELTLLWSDQQHPISRLVADTLEKAGVRRDAMSQSIELGSLASVKSAVVNGLGCAFLPYGLVADEVGDGLLHELPIAGLDLSYPIFAIRRSDHGPPELIDALVELASNRS